MSGDRATWGVRPGGEVVLLAGAPEPGVRPLEAAPVFTLGQEARVREPRAARAGRVRRIVWNFKAAAFEYYLEIDGKSFKTRYRGDELEALAPPRRGG